MCQYTKQKIISINLYTYKLLYYKKERIKAMLHWGGLYSFLDIPILVCVNTDISQILTTY